MPQNISEQHQVRVEKVDALRAYGHEPYPVHVPRSHTLEAVRSEYSHLTAPDEWSGEEVSIAGRVVSLRNGGRLCFATLQENEHTLQVMLDLTTTGTDALTLWRSSVDLGDVVGITGEVGTSMRGELSVKASTWQMAAKSLRPYIGRDAPTDPEVLRRDRTVALLTDEHARRVLKARSALTRSLRTTLWSQNFEEVDTPILHRVHGGVARPFVTHAEALGRDLTLRIAPELHLKRLMSGGCERIFEIGPNFRNEGIDSTHSPEFLMLEAYQAWAEYDTMATVMHTLLREAAQAVNGTSMIVLGGEEVDLAEAYTTASIHELVGNALGTEITPDTPVETLQALATERGVELSAESNGRAVVELFEELVEATLVQPMFVRDWPIEVRPLCRAHRGDPRLTESWDLIINGIEVGTAYSELTDPLEQRRRLEEQARAAARGDDEAMHLDEEFLRALEHGMVPTGGLGLGLDRALMLLTGTASIRDTITFPAMR